MATTDHPLRVLVQQFSRDFAEWLLDTEVLSVEPVNVELTTETLRVDSLLRVLQSNGNVVLLHIEFQGRRSMPAMALRQLGYLSQLIIAHDKGFAEGRAEARAEARSQGQLEGLRQAVLTLTASRFDPPFSKALILERYVDSISDEAKLQALIATLALASSFDAVLADLPNGAASTGT